MNSTGKKKIKKTSPKKKVKKKRFFGRGDVTPTEEAEKKDISKKLVYYKMVVIGLIFIIVAVGVLIRASIIDDLFWKSIITSIGSALLGIGVLSIVFDVFFKLETIKLFQKTLIDELDSQHHFVENGLTRLGDRDDLVYKDFFIDAQSKLKLQGISLPFMNTEHCEPIIVRRVLDKNDDVSIKILLLNPCSLLSYKRAQCKQYDSIEEFYDTLLYHIRRYFHIGNSIIKKSGKELDRNKYDVKLYSSLTYCSLLIQDNIVNISFFLENAKGASTKYFEMVKTDEKGDLYSTLEKHFDICWNNPNAISIFDPEFENRILSMNNSEKEILESKLPINGVINSNKKPSRNQKNSKAQEAAK
jgi:hypothetical protein